MGSAATPARFMTFGGKAAKKQEAARGGRAPFQSNPQSFKTFQETPFPPVMLSMKPLLLALLLGLAVVPQAMAKAYFQNETELVTLSTVIAIVEIAEPQPSEQKGTTWTYRQSATAKVISRIKGDIPDTFTLYGDETFICAQCQLKAGRFLAFLNRDADLWVGANWQLSLRPIKDEKIEWYVVYEQRPAMTYQPSDKVLKRIQELLATPLKTTDK